MIYINNTTEAQAVMVPASCKKEEGELAFSLFSTVNRKEVLSVSVTQLGMSDLYYKFILNLSATLQNGEYEYQLKKGNDVLDCGLAMVVGASEVEEYNNTTTYEQYESE